MGVVYYANYFVYFERGRTEFFRECGFTYKELEKQKIYFPVIDAACHYYAPAKYDDLISVKTFIGELGGASVTFNYEIKCEEVLLVKGFTKHPVVNETMKPIRFPKPLREILETRIKQK
jgi:acyl-CoA thioester hydrolase